MSSGRSPDVATAARIRGAPLPIRRAGTAAGSPKISRQERAARPAPRFKRQPGADPSADPQALPGALTVSGRAAWMILREISGRGHSCADPRRLCILTMAFFRLLRFPAPYFRSFRGNVNHRLTFLFPLVVKPHKNIDIA